MTLIVVDVEADGPIPGKYSMVCFGAVVVEPSLSKTFYGKTRPMTPEWIPEALAVSGFSRKQHEGFPQAKETMYEFFNWVDENSGYQEFRPVFVSDNPAFDWQWINFYFHYWLTSLKNPNPFGFSARRIGDLYCGMKMDLRKNKEWKSLYRKTSHDHNPVNDAKGNAEALLAMKGLGLNGWPPFIK